MRDWNSVDFDAGEWVNEHYSGPDADRQVVQNLLEIRQLTIRRYEFLILERSDEQLDGDVREIQLRLKQFRKNPTVWPRTHETILTWRASRGGEEGPERLSEAAEIRSHMESEDFAIEELSALETVLGDQTFASEIMTAIPPEQVSNDVRTTIDETQVAVSELEHEADRLQASDPGSSKLWRTARFLKKAVIVASGGLAIVADLVVPDPTLITKVASIAGGGSAILAEIRIPGQR